MKLVFISGPYRASTPRGIVENIRRAESVAIKMWKRGYAVICPHKNTALFDGLMPDETWLSGDIEILRRCDAICMVPGWDDSSGSIAEHALAVHLGLEIIEG